jgi:thiamine-phosphate pyrophosphorylase
LAAEVFDPRLELYAITDQKSSLGRSDEEIARELISGGISCLQYRAKKVPAREQWETARRLRSLCRDAGVLFIVNDRCDLALDCGADGVHLGQDDMPIAAARRLAKGTFMIGRSTHSLAQAQEAWQQGADYIGFGPLYATDTKENNVPPVGLGPLEGLLSGLPIPVVVIGGIKMHHLAEIAAAGVEHIAVVTALTGAAEIGRAARDFAGQWRQRKGHRHL